MTVKITNNTLSGLFFVALFAFSATYISEFAIFKELRLSPLIIGIVIGMIYANTLAKNFPKEWNSGIIFSTKTILRLAIVFYGFRLTFNEISSVGISGITLSFLMVLTTFVIGYIVGVKILKMDTETTILTASGSSICGAAAVLATEGVLNSKAYKSTVAVATVVLFGTLAMFLYPVVYKLGILGITPEQMGLFIGGSIHEVAHVVAAGNAVGIDVTSDYAIISKMLRVMFLAPFLIIIGLVISKGLIKTESGHISSKIVIPWFAVFFIVMAGVNSLLRATNVIPQDMLENIIRVINNLDTFALTMAMCALGIQTNVSKFKTIGAKPFYLAFILFVWLIVGGYFITKLVA